MCFEPSEPKQAAVLRPCWVQSRQFGDRAGMREGYILLFDGWPLPPGGSLPGAHDSKQKCRTAPRHFYLQQFWQSFSLYTGIYAQRRLLTAGLAFDRTSPKHVFRQRTAPAMPRGYFPILRIPRILRREKRRRELPCGALSLVWSRIIPPALPAQP